MSQIEQIAEILKEYSLHQKTPHIKEVPLLMRVQERMDQEGELVFILPAFPAKSPCKDKTSGELPDLGEVLALKNLQYFCERISAIYEPGAKIIICSDGRVFSDVVNVPDDSIDRYNEGVKEIIQDYELNSLHLFDLDELYPNMRPVEIREMLIHIYAEDIDFVKQEVRNSKQKTSLFNGVHRFLLEDALSMNPERSKSSIRKETKQLAYELLRRSDAWSSLIEAHFNQALRLSIHPHSLNHDKFGIKLIPSSSKWATPWHNVVVKFQDRFELMHKKEALSLNATFKLEENKYAYFEVSAV